MILTCLRLFFEFFKTGLFSIGGGMATIPFLQHMGEATGWFSNQDLTMMIAVSESTPGPLGINMATYVGYQTAGIPGRSCGHPGCDYSRYHHHSGNCQFSQQIPKQSERGSRVFRPAARLHGADRIRRTHCGRIHFLCGQCSLSEQPSRHPLAHIGSGGGRLCGYAVDSAEKAPPYCVHWLCRRGRCGVSVLNGNAAYPAVSKQK